MSDSVGYLLVFLGGIGIVVVEYMLLYALLVAATANFGSPPTVRKLKRLLVIAPIALALGIAALGTLAEVPFFAGLGVAIAPLVLAIAVLSLFRGRATERDPQKSGK